MSFPSVPAVVLGAQGVVLSAVGLFALVQPKRFQGLQRTSDHGMVKVFRSVISLYRFHWSIDLLTVGGSTLALSLGSIYLVIACHSSTHRHALLANVGLRSIATIVFWQEARGTAVYELTWGLLNAVAVGFTE